MIKRLFLLFRYGFVWRKPKLLWRVALDYLKAFFSKTPPLHYIDFVTDYRCNLACKHCFAAYFARFQKEKLTLKDYQRVAREAMRLGVIHFSFQGGEPLLDPHLPEIIKAFQPQANYISVTTNATLLTPSRLRQLKKLGVDKINVSLDSAIAEEHDKFRGKKGTFQKARRGINLALKMGFRVTVNTTVSHENLYSPGIQRLFSWASRRQIILNPIFACPVGRWQGNKKILMTDADRKEIDRWREKSVFIRRDMDSNWFHFGCPAVKEVLYITPDGEVLPCPFLHFSLGNVKRESLAKIRRRALKYPLFGKYHQRCLASEDEEFLKKYLNFLAGEKCRPVEFEKTKKWLGKII